MKIQEDEKFQINISSNKNYTQINNENNINICINSKFYFSFIIFLLIEL
jgi:hypothetical protein